MSKDEDEEIIIFKIITLGESQVGKTSLLRRYLENKFDSNIISTFGLTFTFKEIILKNGKKVKLKLQDTAGQEKYRALGKSYFKNADGVFFVYSIDNEESFEKIKEWISLFKEINQQNEAIPQYLVETKNDLDRIVDEEKSKEFAKNNNLNWYSTSSKNNNSIDELFSDIAESLYKEYNKKGNKGQKNMLLKNKKNKNKKDKICCMATADIE